MSRDLVDIDGENRALRHFIMACGEPQTYEAFRNALTWSGYEYCIPDWAKNGKGYITTFGVQKWIKFIIAQENEDSQD